MPIGDFTTNLNWTVDGNKSKGKKMLNDKII